jgi:hypothetical protein
MDELRAVIFREIEIEVEKVVHDLEILHLLGGEGEIEKRDSSFPEREGDCFKMPVDLVFERGCPPLESLCICLLGLKGKIDGGGSCDTS